MRSVVFHPSAERELVASARFYDNQALGLGLEFIRELERTITQVVANPGAGSLITPIIRRRLLRRFPFAVLYRAHDERIRVLAIMHLRRRPGYWMRRR